MYFCIYTPVNCLWWGGFTVIMLYVCLSITFWFLLLILLNSLSEGSHYLAGLGWGSNKHCLHCLPLIQQILDTSTGSKKTCSNCRASKVFVYFLYHLCIAVMRLFLMGMQMKQPLIMESVTLPCLRILQFLMTPEKPVAKVICFRI